jgi:hypothetical protein
MTTIRVVLEVQLTSIDMTPEDASAWVAKPGAISLEHVSASGSIEGHVTIPGSAKQCFVTVSNVARPLQAKLGQP